jgi:hypothetical protein
MINDNARRTATGDALADQRPVSYRNVALIVFVTLTWEGLIPVLFGAPIHVGRYFICGLILAGTLLWIRNFLTGRATPIKENLFGPILALYCVVITLNYSMLNAALPAREWLYAQYTLIPLFICFSLNVLGVSWKDVVVAIVAAASICSLISVFDQFFEFATLDVFTRASINNVENRRMFLMRLETGATVALLGTYLLANGRLNARSVIFLVLMLLNAFVLFRVSESRQSILTALLAVFFFVAFGGIKKQRLYYIVTLWPAVLAYLLYLIVGDYIERFISSRDYIKDGNIEIRLQALDFFWRHFNQTSGLGFGILSNGDDARNFLANAFRTGNGEWGFFLADTGIFSALFQFGWIGLVFAVSLPLWAASMLIRAARHASREQRAVLLAFGCIFLSSILHPWPTNLFTLEWTLLFGALTFYAATDAKRVFAALKVQAIRDGAFETTAPTKAISSLRVV